MKYKKITAVFLAAALAMGTMTGCTAGAEQSTETAAETPTEVVDTEPATEVEEVESTEDSSVEQTTYPEIISDKKVKEYQSVVTVGDSGYELYTYLDDVAENYAKVVNKVAKSLDGIADVYDIVIPLSSGITFPDNLRDKITSSDQREAMLAIQGKMSSQVHSVDIYDSLMQHRDEYIYFRTDHHWTALGAYYAYTDFCEAKGIEPEAIESYETKEFDGFLGSFYNDTSNTKLKANPDTVQVYYPHDQSTLHATTADGSEYDWMVIYDVTNYNASTKYSTFIAADEPYQVITNKDLNDGSVCVVVKESFGNAFVPFLVDHYQTIYVIDYRYWTGSISELAEEKQASDVLFLNNLSMIRNKSLVGKLNRVK